jgi:2'-5' RNA ligase
LAFYGEVADSAVDQLADRAVVALADHRPFDLHLTGAGQFPSAVSWIGLGGQVDRLTALMTDCRALGADQSDLAQASRPHLTVSRRRRDRPLADALRALAVYRGPVWTVERAILFSSEPGFGPGGHPSYQALADLPLGPPAAPTYG